MVADVTVLRAELPPAAAPEQPGGGPHPFQMLPCGDDARSRHELHELHEQQQHDQQLEQEHQRSLRPTSLSASSSSLNSTNASASWALPKADTYRKRRSSAMSISAVPTPFAQIDSKEHWTINEEDWEDSSASRPHSPAMRTMSNNEFDARSKWQQAIKSMTIMASTAKQFRTLRDMTSSTAEIPRSSIRVFNVLGKGAFAIVEKCLYTPPCAPSPGSRPVKSKSMLVAVKRLKPALTHSAGDIKDMMLEVALLRKLAHRHIVGFVGAGHWEFKVGEAQQGSLFVVEELVDGGSLKQHVCAQMQDCLELRYRTRDAVRWLRQVAQGLAYLHRSQPQVIHRDLKLDNILLKGSNTQSSEAKIADFGLSALVRRTQAFAQLHQEIISPKSAQPRRARRASATDLDNVWATAAMQRTLTSSPPPPHANKAGAAALPPPKQVQAAAAEAAAARPAPSESAPKCPPSVPAGSTKGRLHTATSYAQLSVRTGTLMYMAPEVYTGQPYNEKADCFSFGVIAYELLQRFMMITATDGSVEECQAYARRVSRGFRPPIPVATPRPLADLIAACWHQEPGKRPSMARVARELKSLEVSSSARASFDALDLYCLGASPVGHRRGGNSCCTIS